MMTLRMSTYEKVLFAIIASALVLFFVLFMATKADARGDGGWVVSSPHPFQPLYP